MLPGVPGRRPRNALNTIRVCASRCRSRNIWSPFLFSVADNKEQGLFTICVPGVR